MVMVEQIQAQNTFKVKMWENFSIKTEAFVNDCKQEDSNKTKHENFTNMLNDIKEDKADLDKMEEFLSESVDKSIIDIIKNEDVDDMDEFLPEDSPSLYSPGSLTRKSKDSAKAITHDEVNQRHLTGTTTQQISLPKLEIIDVHTDENDSKNLEINGDKHANVSDNKERSIISSSRVAQTPTEHKCKLCGNSYKENKNLLRHMINKHPLAIDTEYICEICNERFATQKGLDRHTKGTHKVGQTPANHKCELCGSCFTEYYTLRRHMRHKHPLSVNAEYICEICSQRFNTKTGLDRHSYWTHPETHTPTEHKCEICGTCYMEAKTLLLHIRKNILRL
ncbi:uncharacterized protein isoform X2 [Musca autumnalis]|uniref:uncharacterized protein isoform X2 n=1 Tax=Musca autumnalis TaxID=221902 RepID=UPI003CE8F201